MKISETIEQLRRDGSKLYIKHHRIFSVNGQPIGVGIKSGKDDNALVEEVDNVLTRGEFEQAVEDYNVYVDSGEGCIMIPTAAYGDCVSPKGGFTSVEVVKPDGTTISGKYNFNHKPFCRKTGLRAALGRVLKNV